MSAGAAMINQEIEETSEYWLERRALEQKEAVMLAQGRFWEYCDLVQEFSWKWLGRFGGGGEVFPIKLVVVAHHVLEEGNGNRERQRAKDHVHDGAHQVERSRANSRDLF